MRNLLLFFEISDKVIPVYVMYFTAILLGGIGILLGCWRWWVSAIWFFFPTLLFTSFFISLQIEEINYLYENISKELGESYIWHTYISAGFGLLLNVTGICIGIFKNGKIKLK